jgi:hypothetical protein
MKHCTYCGNQYPDEFEMCPADRQPLKRAGEEQVIPVESVGNESTETISPDEQRFWERMTFRQFAVLIIRLQAVWLLFYAAYNVTYLPAYICRSNEVASYSASYFSAKFELFLAVLRIIAHVAAAVALIQYTERILRAYP